MGFPGGERLLDERELGAEGDHHLNLVSRNVRLPTEQAALGFVLGVSSLLDTPGQSVTVIELQDHADSTGSSVSDRLGEHERHHDGHGGADKHQNGDVFDKSAAAVTSRPAAHGSAL